MKVFLISLVFLVASVELRTVTMDNGGGGAWSNVVQSKQTVAKPNKPSVSSEWSGGSVKASAPVVYGGDDADDVDDGYGTDNGYGDDDSGYEVAQPQPQAPVAKPKKVTKSEAYSNDYKVPVPVYAPAPAPAPAPSYAPAPVYAPAPAPAPAPSYAPAPVYAPAPAAPKKVSNTGYSSDTYSNNVYQAPTAKPKAKVHAEPNTIYAAKPVPVAPVDDDSDQSDNPEPHRIPSASCPSGFAETIYQGGDLIGLFCYCDNQYSYALATGQDSCKTSSFKNPCQTFPKTQFHPADSRLPKKYFVHCQWNMPRLKVCNGLLAWNNEKQVCDWDAQFLEAYDVIYRTIVNYGRAVDSSSQ